MSHWKQPVICAVVHIFVWLLTYYVVVALTAASPSRVAYGILSAWWCTLYVGYILEIDAKATLFVIMAMLLFDLAAFYRGWDFYHDPPSEMTSNFALTMLVRGVGFASPILVNSIVIRPLSWFRSRGRK